MNQGWMNKLERKFGWFKIQGLAKYIVAIELVGVLIGVFAPNVYWVFLSLDFNAVMHGQVWRLFTFIFYPSMASLNIVNVVFLAIELYLYYFIGNSLENMWGSFWLTLYYFSGYIFSVVAAFIVYIVTGITFWPAGFDYINEALFLAFATMFPNEVFLLYFVLPIKAKWFAIVYLALMGYQIISYLSMGTLGVVFAVAIIISMLNYLVFFLSTRSFVKMTPTQRKRRRKFKKDTRGAKVVPIYRHRCAICGRTEKDGEDIEFRFCSKCDGNYEYCDQHIFTHEHVRRQNPM